MIPMKVSEVIALLQQLPQDAEVVTQRTFYRKHDNRYGRITAVNLEPLDYTRFGIYDPPYPGDFYEQVLQTVILEFEEIEQEDFS
jgi:hypothetical protein